MRLGSVMAGPSRRSPMEWAAPIGGRAVAARVLSCLRAFATVGEARGLAPLQGDVTVANLFAQPLVAPVATESLELFVRIEDQRGPAEAPREPGAPRMQSHHEEGAPPVAE